MAREADLLFADGSDEVLQPNPSAGLFQLTAADGTPLTLAVHDAAGRVVHGAFTLASATATTLDLGHLETGSYYLVATRLDQRRVLPLVIRR